MLSFSSYAWRLLCIAFCQSRGLAAYWPAVQRLHALAAPESTDDYQRLVTGWSAEELLQTAAGRVESATTAGTEAVGSGAAVKRSRGGQESGSEDSDDSEAPGAAEPPAKRAKSGQPSQQASQQPSQLQQQPSQQQSSQQPPEPEEPSAGELFHQFLVWLLCGVDHRQQAVLCLHRTADHAEVIERPPRAAAG